MGCWSPREGVAHRIHRQRGVERQKDGVVPMLRMRGRIGEEPALRRGQRHGTGQRPVGLSGSEAFATAATRARSERTGWRKTC